MLVSKVLTEPCPSKSDGSAHQCINCSENIAVGAQVLDFGRRGFSHYPDCHNAKHSGHATQGGLDLQDLVAERMLGQRGKSFDAAESAAGAHTDDVQAFLRDCASLGPPDPRTGLRRGQDLQDAVAERVLESRGGRL